MEKRNKSFLDGILFVLGERKKHPWGESLGFKNARISSIFKGIPPTADALEVIARAENVNINWLLTGEGPPFYTYDWYNEEQVKVLLSSAYRRQFILTDSGGRATLITGAPMRDERDDIVIEYYKLHVIPDINIDLLKEYSHARADGQFLINVDPLILTSINEGYKSPVHLYYEGVLNAGRKIVESDFDIIYNAVKRDSISSADAKILLESVESLDFVKRRAIITIAQSLSNPHNVNINQLPPGGIERDTKSQTLSVHEKPATPYKNHSGD